MCKIGLNIKTISPLLLTAGPPAHNLIETQEAIPGNTIRGLLARRYLDILGKADDELFRRLFLLKQVKYGFAFIEGAEAIPLSARSCKYHSGFKNDDDGHGVTDLVFAGDKEKKCAFVEENEKPCERSLEPFNGFYDPKENKVWKIKKRLITRTAIDSERGSAAVNKLFSQRVIEENQTFISTIETDEDDLKDALKRLLKKSFTAFIGKGRSRGQGWATIEQAPTPEDMWGNVTDRFLRCAPKKTLVLTLLRDAIFQDEYLRDCSAPSGSHLQNLLKTSGIILGEDEIKLSPDFADADTRMVFGFDGEPIWLPRVPRLAVKAGSVFCFNSTREFKLDRMTGDGVGWTGDKNDEGFGLAILWHPFHSDNREGF